MPRLIDWHLALGMKAKMQTVAVETFAKCRLECGLKGMFLTVCLDLSDMRCQFHEFAC